MGKILTLDNKLSNDKKPIKIDEKSTGLLLSDNNVSVENQPTEDNHVATKRYVDDNAGGSVALNDLTDVTYSSGDLTISSLDKIVADDFVIDSGASVELDSHNGNFIAKKAGTEFSSSNSAYAGMILAYRDIGLNETEASYNLTTSYAVPTAEFGISFIAPPSGNVQYVIENIWVDYGSGNAGDFYAGLTTAHASYSTLESYHEKNFGDGEGRGAENLNSISWTLTGLNAGSSYAYWVGFKSTSTTGTPHMSWGSDAANGAPDIIIKAIALPETIST